MTEPEGSPSVPMTQRWMTHSAHSFSKWTFRFSFMSILLACVYVLLTFSGAQGGQKRLLEPLELELDTVVNSHVGNRN